MMYLKLKKAILDWLIENKNIWQRTNACTEKFRQYIYDENGQYIIGGKDVANFINAAENLLYGGK